jgi:hypothetical protein
MKTKFCTLILIVNIFTACNKDITDNIDPNIIVGGVYVPYTNLVKSNTSSSIIISDSVYQFNKTVASYYSHKPTTNQNVLVIQFSDSLNQKNKSIEIQIFTKLMNPETFFLANSMKIDSIIISNNSVYENFFNINSSITWENAKYENFSFKGKGYVELFDTVRSSNTPKLFYPKQRINFDFND